MLAFIDESGHPHPNDRATRPAVAAICIDEGDTRHISRQLFNLKKDLLTPQELEFKAVKLLTRATFRRRSEKKELVEAFFDLCRNLPFTVFSIVMERPQKPPSTSPNFLPNQFRYLLQRINLFMGNREGMAIVLVDGDGSQYHNLPRRFSNFLHKSLEGQSMTKITCSPFFVDSKITDGIQVADMIVSVVRQYEENELFRGIPRGDAFLHAIARYHHIVKDKTIDQWTPDGYLRQGFYRMPESDHYYEELTEKPENQT